MKTLQRFRPLLTFAFTTMVTALLFSAPQLRDSRAAFELNFNPNTNTDHFYTSTFSFSNYSCNMSFSADFNCTSGGFGGSFQEGGAHSDGAAYQRMFSYGGKDYYHVIIGDSTVDSFYLEYMIEANSGWDTYNGFSGYAASASTGDNSTLSSREYNMINPYDSDSSKTGTGTGNPNRVVMRQVLDDGTTYNEFLKDQFDKKPLITQTMSDPDPTEGITQEYTLDMRGKTYSDNTPITENERANRTILIGNTAANQGDYDDTYAVITPTYFREGNDTISAGAYTYTPGSGYGGSNGTYTYYQADGVTENPTGFQPVNLDYSVFCIQSQNNDWSGNGPCTNGDGSGGGRGPGGGWGGWMGPWWF